MNSTEVKSIRVELSTEVGNVNCGYCPGAELSELDGDQELNEGAERVHIETGKAKTLPKDELLHTDKGKKCVSNYCIFN